MFTSELSQTVKVPSRRELTRRQRQDNKPGASFNVSICATNFVNNANVAYLARSLGCFGGKSLHIIGKIPPHAEMRKYSGTSQDLIEVIQHQNPVDFITFCAQNGIKIIAVELDESAIDIKSMRDFSRDEEVCFVVGNEMDGVPVEIMKAAEQVVYIPMPGKGFCLNTSQTGNIMLYEYYRRMNQ